VAILMQILASLRQRSSLLAAIALAAPLASVSAQVTPLAPGRRVPVPRVIVVGPALGPGIDFTAINPALNAAEQRQVIVVRASASYYAPFTARNKGVTILFEDTARTYGTSIVRNLASGRELRLVDFQGNGLRLLNNAGNVFALGGRIDELDVVDHAGLVWIEDTEIRLCGPDACRDERMGFGVSVAHVYQGQKIADLEQVIQEEEAESRRLAPEIAKIKRLNEQRQELNERLDAITRLDRDRYFRVHLLDELNRSIPEHMWLTRFEDVGGDRYAVEGVTFSNFLVSDFLQNLTQSPYFAAVDLLVAERGLIGDVKVVKFKAQTTAVRTPHPVQYEG